MTINRVIEVLNRERHGMHDDWYYLDELVYQRDSGGDPIFTYFEAVAIAEKYERQAKLDPAALAAAGKRGER